jgi:hypothetical protein
MRSYDAVIAIGTDVRAFMGLEAHSPTIANLDLDASNEHGARVTISNTNTPSNQILFYAAGVTGGNVSRQTLGYNRDGQSSWAIISWAASGDVTLSAQAFLADLDPETQSVVGYSGFASKAWSNAAQQPNVDWTPEFQAPTFKTKTIHVELSIPADVSIEWYSVMLRQASGESGPIGTFYAGASADLLVPDLPGLHRRRLTPGGDRLKGRNGQFAWTTEGRAMLGAAQAIEATVLEATRAVQSTKLGTSAVVRLSCPPGLSAALTRLMVVVREMRPDLTLELCGDLASRVHVAVHRATAVAAEGVAKWSGRQHDHAARRLVR